jgi:hypothetical protein
MPQPHSAADREQVADTMIGLTRLSNLHRAIIGGSDSLELYLYLRRRGFVHVTTTATCRIARRQHAIGLITGQGSLLAVEAVLAQMSQFLCPSAAIAIVINSRESGFSLKVRARLQQMGFRIEAGVRCQQGLVLSAYRQTFGEQGFGQQGLGELGFGEMENVA